MPLVFTAFSYNKAVRQTGLPRRARPHSGILHLRASAHPARRAFYLIGGLSYDIKKYYDNQLSCFICYTVTDKIIDHIITEDRI